MSKLIIKYGNILDYLENMDAIVNSNNQYMICGSGVCGAIYKKAGKERLEKYCKDNFKELMKVNEVRITPGFDLGIDIIHIYCPKAFESKNPLEDLKQSYINIFKEVKKRKYKNIVSVSLGTGVHDYKNDDILDEMISLINKLINEYDINFSLILSDNNLKFFI